MTFVQKLLLWVYAMIAAAVGGGGTALSAAIAGQAIGALDFTWRQIGAIAIGGAITAVALYLKDKPLPMPDGVSVKPCLLIAALAGAVALSSSSCTHARAVDEGLGVIATPIERIVNPDRAELALYEAAKIYEVAVETINFLHAQKKIDDVRYAQLIVAPDSLARRISKTGLAVDGAIAAWRRIGSRAEFDTKYSEFLSGVSALAREAQ